MPNRSSKPKKEDLNQTAHRVVAGATGEIEKPPTKKKNPAAVALGRRGGLKGGRARAASLTAEQRKAIAQRAAQARWNKPGKDQE